MSRLRNGTLVIFWSPVCIPSYSFSSPFSKGELCSQFCDYHFPVFLYLDLSWQIWNLDDWIDRDLWRDWKISFLGVCIYITKADKIDASHLFTSQMVKNQETYLCFPVKFYLRKIKFISVSLEERVASGWCVTHICSQNYKFGFSLLCALAGPTIWLSLY